jgi:hypothetical protein
MNSAFFEPETSNIMKITAVSAVTQRAIQPVRPLDDVQQRTASRQTAAASVVARSASFVTPFGMPGGLPSGLTRSMSGMRPKSAAVPQTAANRRTQIHVMADTGAAGDDTPPFINLTTVPGWYAPEEPDPVQSDPKYSRKKVIHFGGDFAFRPDDLRGKTIPDLMQEHKLTPEHLNMVEIAMTHYGDAAKLMGISRPVVEVMKELGYTTNQGVRSLCELARKRELQADRRKAQIEYLRDTTGLKDSEVLKPLNKPEPNPLESHLVRQAVEEGYTLRQIALHPKLNCTTPANLIAVHTFMEGREKQAREERKRSLN